MRTANVLEIHIVHGSLYNFDAILYGVYNIRNYTVLHVPACESIHMDILPGDITTS